MQDWTVFKCHGRASMDVFSQFRQVLRLAREKATVNEKVRFPGQDSNIPVFETEAQTTLHARTEDCSRRGCPRSRNADFGRNVLQLWGTAVVSIRAEWASQAS
jgi:hypothetical protein